MRQHHTAPGVASRALALTAMMLGLTAEATPDATLSPVVGAGRTYGLCDCPSPRPNRRNRCRTCHRDLPPPPRVEGPKIEEDLSECPFYESLQIVDSSPVGPDLANITLREPGTDRRWMVRLPPEHFPVGWWTARTEGGSSDGMFATFAYALETPPDDAPGAS